MSHRKYEGEFAAAVGLPRAVVQRAPQNSQTIVLLATMAVAVAPALSLGVVHSGVAHCPLTASCVLLWRRWCSPPPRFAGFPAAQAH